MQGKLTVAAAACLVALVWGGEAAAAACSAANTKNLPSCVDLDVSDDKQQFWATNRCSYPVMMDVTVADGVGSGRTKLNPNGQQFHMDIANFQSPSGRDTAKLTDFACCDKVEIGDGTTSSCG